MSASENDEGTMKASTDALYKPPRAFPWLYKEISLLDGVGGGCNETPLLAVDVRILREFMIIDLCVSEISYTSLPESVPLIRGLGSRMSGRHKRGSLYGFQTKFTSCRVPTEHRPVPTSLLIV